MPPEPLPSIESQRRRVEQRHEASTELTEQGEQYVVPGCEQRHARRPGEQGNLWD